jgi:hypothetical protein
MPSQCTTHTHTRSPVTSRATITHLVVRVGLLRDVRSTGINSDESLVGALATFNSSSSSSSSLLRLLRSASDTRGGLRVTAAAAANAVACDAVSSGLMGVPSGSTPTAARARSFVDTEYVSDRSVVRAHKSHHSHVTDRSQCCAARHAIASR